MPADYIPKKQLELRTWALNFSTLITAAPGVYGLVAGDAVTIAAQYAAYNVALTAAIDPATRTPTNVADKDAARASMLAVLRPYAIQIRNNVGVSDENKIALGLTVVDRTPTPIPAPTTIPVISVSMQTALQMTMQSYDATTPTSKAKPFGAIAMQIARKTSATPIADPSALPIVDTVTTSPFTLNWSGADQGLRAYIAARWITRKGLPGPWSAIVEAIVA